MSAEDFKARRRFVEQVLEAHYWGGEEHRAACHGCTCTACLGHAAPAALDRIEAEAKTKEACAECLRDRTGLTHCASCLRESSAAAMREALEKAPEPFERMAAGLKPGSWKRAVWLGVVRDLREEFAPALATDAGAGLLAEVKHLREALEAHFGDAESPGDALQELLVARESWRAAEGACRDAEAALDLLRAQRADLREELNRAALDLSAARAELANRDATLAALRDAVTRLERLPHERTP